MCGIIIRENLAKENMDYEIGLTYENEMEKEESMRKMHKAHFDEAEEIKPQKCERIVIQTKYRMCACEWSPSHGTWFAAAAPSTSDWRLCYRLPNYNTAHANALPCCLFLLFIFFFSFFLSFVLFNTTPIWFICNGNDVSDKHIQILCRFSSTEFHANICICIIRLFFLHRGPVSSTTSTVLSLPRFVLI